MWTPENRALYDRKGLRYPSDLTDEEWKFVEPLLPPPRKVCRRALVNGVFYVLTTGCQWRQLPKDFPPKSTTHDYFVEINCMGILKKIHHELYGRVREAAGRAPEPTMAIVDSQSVKSAEKGGPKLIRADMTQARKLKAKNAMRLSISSGC